MSTTQKMVSRINISEAESPVDIAVVRELFKEYASWLGFSLCFQSFDEELTTLPGNYASPAGRLLLLKCDDAVAGCGALRPLELGVCEMKRLYVRSEFRRRRLGLMLAQRLIDEARLIGYNFMRLDTVPKQMPDANQLYRSLGFYEIPAYCYNLQPEVTYLELRLQ